MALVKYWPITATFTDEGMSGTKDAAARPGLHALLAAADAGCAGYVRYPSRKTKLNEISSQYNR